MAATLTYDQFVNDDDEWNLATIARELDVKYQTAKTWRRDSLAALRDQIDRLALTEQITTLGLHPDPERFLRTVRRQLKRPTPEVTQLLDSHGVKLLDRDKKVRPMRLLITDFSDRLTNHALYDQMLGLELGPVMWRLSAMGVDALNRYAAMVQAARGLDPELTPGAMTWHDADKLGYTPHPNQLPLPDVIRYTRIALWVATRIKRWGLQSHRFHPTTFQAQHSKPPGRPPEQDEEDELADAA